MSYTKTTWVNNTTPINETNLNKIESGIKNNDINIGEENYDNTKTYEVGDIVRYNEKIYKCITAITTAENFDISKWEQTNIVEIVQSEKSKIYELIEAISTPIVGEGENITLNDTAEKRFENFDIEGNSEQATRSGKNKLQNTLESQTINGLTVVVNDDKTIKINGTATATTLLTIGTMTFIANQQYYVSGCPSGGSASTYRIDYRTANEAVDFTEYGTGAIVNKTQDTTLTAKIRIASGATLSNLIFAPMVTEGSTVSDYEQYGAMPSPDYPSEVQTVGDNVNIFDKEKYRNINNWSNSQGFFICCKLDEEDTEKFKKIITGSISLKGKLQNLVFGISTTNSASSFNNQYRMLDNGTIKNITYDFSNAENIYLCIGNANKIGTDKNEINLIFDNYNIKFEEGTVATPYSPYGQGCINEVICNKNLFDKNNPQYLDGYGLNPTGFFARGDQRTYIIPVPQNKENITVSYTKNLTGSRYYAFADEIPTNESSSHYERIMFANSSDTGKITFTAKNNNYKYLLIGSITLEVFTDLQVEQNPTATPYEEHKEQTYTIPVQQPMRAIGDTRDKFILKENGKWYERHNIARKIFDGTEEWSTSVESQFELLGTNYKKYQNGGVCICSHFPYGLNIDNHIWIGNDKFILIKDIIYTTLEEFKTWLTTQYNAGTPVYVDYILETPLDIECTSEQTEILNQIYIKAKSYKGVTHIYSNDAVSPNCYVEAVKDLTTLIQ